MTEPAAISHGEQLHIWPRAEGQNGGHLTDVESQEKPLLTAGGFDIAAPGPAAAIEDEEEPKLAHVGYVDILKQFSILGWLAFGGPVAHIALFQKVSRTNHRSQTKSFSLILRRHNLCEDSQRFPIFVYAFGD